MSSDKREVDRYSWHAARQIANAPRTFVDASAHDAAVAQRDAVIEAGHKDRMALAEKLDQRDARISQLEFEKAAANGLREGHALVVRKLDQRIAQLEAALELHEQRDREQSMCVMYTHEEEEARDKRISQLETERNVLKQDNESHVARAYAAEARVTQLEAGIRDVVGNEHNGFVLVVCNYDISKAHVPERKIRALRALLPASGEG